MALPTTDYYKIMVTYLEQNGDPIIAAAQKQYMRNQFEFYGLKSPDRRLIQKAILVEYGMPTIEQLPNLLELMWQNPHRDMQLYGIDLIERSIKKVEKDFIIVLEKLIITKSWWDTVDMLAGKLVARHFKRFPELLPAYPNKWIASDNMWLQRSAIIFQLKYRKTTDTDLLFNYILKFKDSKEFFIQKAAGWALREYSKIDWELVLDFINQHNLAPLTKREGLKWMKQKGVL